jgi:hypothetical protein
MAYVGHGNHYYETVVFAHVGSPNVLENKRVLQRGPRTGRILFHAGTMLPNIEEPTDAAVRKFFEKANLTLAANDSTMFRGEDVCVPYCRHPIARRNMFTCMLPRYLRLA